MHPSSRSSWTGSAILFDLDGTLVESMSTIERHTRLWALRHGLDPDHTLEVWHGRRDSDVIADFVPPDRVEAELQWMRDLSCRDVTGIAAAPGSRELVAALPPEAWGIVTSGEREVALCRLAAAGIPEPRVLVSADDVVNGKPHPEGFLKAAAALGVDPAECLVFEDAMAGVEGARAAGMEAIMLGDAATSGAGVRYLSGFKKVRAVVAPEKVRAAVAPGMVRTVEAPGTVRTVVAPEPGTPSRLLLRFTA
ncbi:HAD-IA family hydrolase [Streptomyces sp. NPDC053253]|uniref:HAD-IA family hydrolase n=1 Tax=Streptomyces sp. NPDC053253 TaxID=3365699 RepID=UPI0037D439B9